MAKRPPTQEEIRRSRSSENRRETLTILNISKQVIPIHCKPAPGGDFFVSAHDVQLQPGRRTTLPKHRLWESQISRLRKRHLIEVVSDSERVKETKRNANIKRHELDRAKAQRRKEIEAIRSAEADKKKTKKTAKKTSKKKVEKKSEDS